MFCSQLWPVQHGSRVAVFQVGKGCRLLYSPHSMFGSEQQLRQTTTPAGMADAAFLLCPNGQLITISVPYPALVRWGVFVSLCLSVFMFHEKLQLVCYSHRVSSARSHDAHLLNKLESAISSGDRHTLEEIATTVKSSSSLQEVCA